MQGNPAYFGRPRTSAHNPMVQKVMHHQNPLASGLALLITLDMAVSLHFCGLRFPGLLLAGRGSRLDQLPP